MDICVKISENLRWRAIFKGAVDAQEQNIKMDSFCKNLENRSKFGELGHRINKIVPGRTPFVMSGCGL